MSDRWFGVCLRQETGSGSTVSGGAASKRSAASPKDCEGRGRCTECREKAERFNLADYLESFEEQLSALTTRTS